MKHGIYSFMEKRGEKQGQRRKRFLQFLRDIPPPGKRFDDKRKVWIPYDSGTGPRP